MDILIDDLIRLAKIAQIELKEKIAVNNAKQLTTPVNPYKLKKGKMAKTNKTRSRVKKTGVSKR